MIRCAGPAPPPHITHNSKLLPVADSVHPVETALPNVNVPPAFTVIACPELDERVEPAPPPLKVKLRSLSSWVTSVGLACKFVSVTSREPALVVKVADALTGPPEVVAPGGVVNVIVLALAEATNTMAVRTA